MIYLFYTVHILVCIFLILVVLLQQGKGADLSVFGGGSTQTVFGARGAATFLHKMTVAGFIAFTITTISIGLLSGSATSSVFSGAEAPAIEEAVESSVPFDLPDAETAVDGVTDGTEAIEEEVVPPVEPDESATDAEGDGS